TSKNLDGSRLWPCCTAFVPASITDMLTCEPVSSSNSMRSHTVSATRSSTARSSRRLGRRMVMISGLGASAMRGRDSGGWADRERTQALERLAKVQRRFGLETKLRTRQGVNELQFGGVQRLPPKQAQQGVREATLALAKAQPLFDPT